MRVFFNLLFPSFKTAANSIDFPYIVENHLLKKRLYFILPSLLGLVLGVVLAYRAIQAAGQNKNLVLRNAEWGYFASMDLAENDLQRAFIGRIGLFALQDSEAIYFIANQDNEGKPLNADSQYLIEGQALDAAYWSITLYGEDHFLIPNEEKRFSYNQVNVQYKDSLKGRYQIQLGGNKTMVNHLPMRGEQQVNLLLRLYQPSSELYTNREGIALPSIKRLDNE